MHDPFFTRENMLQLADQFNVNGHIWGSANRQAVDLAADLLQVEFPAELRDFGEHIGNLSVGGLGITVTGPEPDRGPVDNCATATFQFRRYPELFPYLTEDHIAICRMERHYYFCLAGTGEVVAYGGLDYGGLEERRWPTLRTWLEWVFPYAKWLDRDEEDYDIPPP